MSTIPQARVYAPGADVTCQATAAITARRFVAISGNRATAGNLSVAPAAAAARAFGVAKDTVANGELVGIVRGGIVRVDTGGAITAGIQVQVGTDGKAVTHIPSGEGAGVAVGYAVSGAADASTGEIVLYS